MSRSSVMDFKKFVVVIEASDVDPGVDAYAVKFLDGLGDSRELD